MVKLKSEADSLLRIFSYEMKLAIIYNYLSYFVLFPYFLFSVLTDVMLNDKMGSVTKIMKRSMCYGKF